MRKVALALLALALSGCSAGVSSRCGVDWIGTYMCETRWHHAGKPATFAAYAYDKDGNIIPLYAAESSSILAPLEALSTFAP